jgi:hypothetical protein
MSDDIAFLDRKAGMGLGEARHSLGLVVEDDDLVGVVFRAAKSQAADREIDDFTTLPSSRPG